jgi:hypothetical protein
MNCITVEFFICVCYLPPENSVHHDALQLYTTQLEQFYSYQNMGSTYICGDVNSRCGDLQDFIAGVDDIQDREGLDNVLNRNGELLIEFLTDCNICMINGRVGVQDYTNISTKGKSNVDYIVIPHGQMHVIIDFNVYTMSAIISEFNLNGYDSVPDHSILQCRIRSSADQVGQSQSVLSEVARQAPRRFKPHTYTGVPFISERMRVHVLETITRIENMINERQNMNAAYREFKMLLISEMELNYREVKNNALKNVSKRSMRKLYWNAELQNLWDNAMIAEKNWKSCKNTFKSLTAFYVHF